MIVGFSRYGTGGGFGPTNYHTSEKNPDGSLRTRIIEHEDGSQHEIPAKPVVLRGDPEIVRSLIDTNPFKHKYTSGVLSFSESPEDITPDMKNRIMDAFERIAFAGLQPGQYSILWTEHSHAGHGELNFLVPRMVFPLDKDGEININRPRSLNIRPPSKQSDDLFDNFRSWVNTELGLSNPDDNRRRKDVSISNVMAKLDAANVRAGDASMLSIDRDEIKPLSEMITTRLKTANQTQEKLAGTTKLREELRSTITAYIRHEVDSGRIHDRSGVVDYLKQSGFEITRPGKTALSILHPDALALFPDLTPEQARSKATIRLKGGLFDAENFDPNPTLARNERPPIKDTPDPQRAAHFRKNLERLGQSRARYNRGRYGLPGQDEPFYLERSQIPAPNPEKIEPLDDFMKRTLGDNAILSGEDKAPSIQYERRINKMRGQQEAISKANDEIGNDATRLVTTLGAVIHGAGKGANVARQRIGEIIAGKHRANQRISHASRELGGGRPPLTRGAGETIDEDWWRKLRSGDDHEPDIGGGMER